MSFFGSVLLLMHLVAMIAGGRNAVLQFVSVPVLMDAGPETCTALYRLQDAVAKLGRISMATLIVTGFAMLWLKWDFCPPNAFFWLKMLGLAGMFCFIVLGDRKTAEARSGGPSAAPAMLAKAVYGQLTTLCLLVVIASAVLTFR